MRGPWEISYRGVVHVGRGRDRDLYAIAAGSGMSASGKVGRAPACTCTTATDRPESSKISVYIICTEHDLSIVPVGGGGGSVIMMRLFTWASKFVTIS